MPGAILFDFNGVIVDDEHHHFGAFREVLAEEGVALTEEMYFTDYLGLDDREMLSTALVDAGAAPVDEPALCDLVTRKAVVYQRLISGGVPLFPGAKELIQALAGEVPLALVSGAIRPEIEMILRSVSLWECFQVVVSTEEMQAGKPDPEGYLIALKRLRDGVPGCASLAPSDCLVIEDAPNGIAAARAAGMVCLGVANSRPPADLFEANEVVPGLVGMDAARLEQLFSKV